MGECKRCEGKGYRWVLVAVSHDDADAEKEQCDECDGTGKEIMCECGHGIGQHNNADNCFCGCKRFREVASEAD